MKLPLSAKLLMAGAALLVLGEVRLPFRMESAVGGESPPAPAATSAPALPRLTQAPATAPAATPAPAQGPAKAEAPAVDETALRYFARQGDAARLQTEIARLKALYPDWTPPADPLTAPAVVDAKLDAMWRLYSEGKIAAVRRAIADRQAAEPAWQPPADLLERLSVAEAREQIVNASDLGQFETVIRVSAGVPSLLTCGDLDVLWRVAEAFGKTDRPDRAEDAYRYVLQNCGTGPERLATVQKAVGVLPRERVEALVTVAGGGEDAAQFAVIQDDLARQAVAAGGVKADVSASAADLDRVKRLSETENQPADALMLGWYYILRQDSEAARGWFARARDAQDSAQASQGLALALIALNRPDEAEDVLYVWRDESDETRAAYMAAVANALAIAPPLALDEARLGRIAGAVAAMQDAAAAQQFGWYADALNQFETAAQWFTAALGWKADDEASAYGLALMRWKLGQSAGVKEMQRLWAGRSERIATVGRPQPDDPLRPTARIPSALDPSGPGRAASTDANGYAPAAGAYSPLDPSARAAGAGVQAEGGYPPRAGVYPAATDAYAPAARVYAPAAEPPPDRMETAALPRREAAPPAEPAQPRRAAAPRRERSRGCSATLDPETLSPDAALSRGWCLMERDRPLEAAEAFKVGRRGRTAQNRNDAAYGESLAYLRAGLRDRAAVAAASPDLGAKRSREVRAALLASQAQAALETKRYADAIFALDERARIAPERTDLMVLRGYAYVGLRRPEDARRLFEAAAATGNREGRRGLGALAAQASDR